jgi:hypothetical protein
MSPADVRKRYGLTTHASLHAAGLLAIDPRVRISSGRRSRWRNRLVGGSPTSFHLSGRAADFVVPSEAVAWFVQTARAQRVSPNCTGPEEVINEGDHVHVAW